MKHAVITIMVVLLSSLLFSVPTVSEYLANIPDFAVARDDFSLGNYMVTGIDRVVIPISETGADITDVLRYNKIRFLFDAEFDNYIKTIDFGDGLSESSSTEYIDHTYDIPQSMASITYTLSLSLFRLGDHRSFQFNITISPLLNNLSIITAFDDTKNVNLTKVTANDNDVIRKPILVVEGYAVTGSTAASSVIGMNPTFFSDLLNQGYDIFILTFGNKNQESLIDNSRYVLGALRYIKRMYDPNYVVSPIKILGYSMGGILARLSLDYAEQGDNAHFSNAMFTLDSPHRGLLINENAQNTMNGIFVSLVLDDEQEAMIDKMFNSDAAKQMIRNNIVATNPSAQNGSNEYRETYGILNSSDSNGQALINNTGFPHLQNNISNYAVALGSNSLSGNVSESEYFSQIYIQIKLGRFLSYTQNILNIPSTWYDKTPGSLIPISSHYAHTISEANWPDFLEDLLGTPKVKIILSQSYIPPMVPTISSLCIESVPFTNGDFNTPLPASFSTPFEDYFISPTAGYHNIISSETASWVLNKLDSIESKHVGYATGSVSRQGSLCGGASVTIHDLIGNHVYHTTSNDEGQYSFPLIYISACDYEITFESDLSYPLSQIFSVLADSLTGNAIIPNVSVPALSVGNIIVSQNDPAYFQTINAALDHVIHNSSSQSISGVPVNIKVLGGTYPENIDLTPLINHNISRFTLDGSGTATIDGNSGEYCIQAIAGAYPQTTPFNYTIKDMTIKNAKYGIYYKDLLYEDYNTVPNIKLSISNCAITNCGGNSYDNAAGGGVHFEGAGIIDSNLFSNNSMCSYSSSNTSIAGALFINHISTDSVFVNNNDFVNNKGSVAGALVINGSGRVVVSLNNFTGNYSDGYSHGMPEGQALSVFEAGNTTIRNNTFIDNLRPSCSGSSVTLCSLLEQTTDPIEFINNTIINTQQIQNEEPIALTFDIQGPSYCQDIHIFNNVFSYSRNTGCKVVSDGNIPWNFNHNVFFNTHPVSFIIDTENINNPRYNYVCDPHLNADYEPIWNSTTMSPCIDAGIGEKDPDKTPPDIGARRAISHEYWDYTFATQADQEKWYWVSYPVLNSRTNNMLKASTFFEKLLLKHQDYENGEWHWTPTFLNEIDWMIPGGLQHILWNDIDWSENQSTHYVSSPQGYKIKFIPETRSVTIKESGFRTASETQFPIYGGVENWLGYFRADAAWPHDVFASIWDDINMIKTKDWCLIRARTDGDYWGLSGKLSPLKSGDMVVVTTNNTHEFQWNDANATPPESKAAPEHFIFNEKQDYVPVYVTIPDSIKIDLKEIGLYLDGVCKGAVVVEDSLEQICAYLDINEKLNDGVVEFVFYYNSDKSAPRESKKMHLDSSRLAAQYIKGNRSYPYYEVALSSKDMENVVPIELALNQNFPNPFNPSTTISYQLPTSSDVRLEIYNLKGQLVKTLVNARQDCGYHSITWNGTDANNLNVASGVYFYRLCSSGKNVTRKMLLMK